MKKRTSNLTPKSGSVADYKRDRAFSNRTITPLAAIAEGVTFAALFAAFVILCAVA